MNVDMDHQAVGQTHMSIGECGRITHTTSVRVFEQLVQPYNLIDVFRSFAPDKK